MGSIRARVAPDERAAVRRFWLLSCCLGTLLRCLVQMLAAVMGTLYILSVVCSAPREHNPDTSDVDYLMSVEGQPEVIVTAPEPERITRDPSYGTL